MCGFFFSFFFKEREREEFYTDDDDDIALKADAPLPRESSNTSLLFLMLRLLSFFFFWILCIGLKFYARKCLYTLYFSTSSPKIAIKTFETLSTLFCGCSSVRGVKFTLNDIDTITLLCALLYVILLFQIHDYKVFGLFNYKK